MPTVMRDDALLHYDVVGNGPWLTLLHAFSQDSRVWDAQCVALQHDFRLIVPDMRGHGQSAHPTSGYGVTTYMHDLRAILDEAGASSTHLWGTHTGAAIALLLAAEFPDRVASLILEGVVIPGVVPASVAESDMRARNLARTSDITAAVGDWFDSAPFFNGMRQAPEHRRLARHREIVCGFSGMPWLDEHPTPPPADFTHRLATIRQPAILVNGSEDAPDFLATAGQVADMLPNVRRYLIPGAGAFPAWEEPHAITPAVQQFLHEVD